MVYFSIFRIGGYMKDPQIWFLLDLFRVITKRQARLAAASGAGSQIADYGVDSSLA